jgi:hypothetical protein
VNDLYNLEVFNDIGQNMYTNKIDVKANTTSTINLPSTDWAKGMYFIKAQANIKNQITSLKFIKN